MISIHDLSTVAQASRAGPIFGSTHTHCPKDVNSLRVTPCSTLAEDLDS